MSAVRARFHGSDTDDRHGLIPHAIGSRLVGVASLTLTALGMVFVGPCALRAQTLVPGPAAQRPPSGEVGAPSIADGVLEGAVTRGCDPGTACGAAKPYQVTLLLQGAGGSHKLIRTDAEGRFTIAVAPGVYSLISADTRSSFSLPLLRPMTVSVAPGQTTRIEVRFEPGPKLPVR